MAVVLVSVYPIVVGLAVAMLAFGLWLPWLVRESRRPVRVPVLPAPDPTEHAAIPVIAISVRSMVVALSRARVHPDPEVSATIWRAAFSDQLRRPPEPEPPNGKVFAMPQRSWNAKRERQYEHIKEGLESRGRSDAVAEEIAARTVNKERARAGEARRASRSSTRDISSGRRGGLRSHQGPGGRTKEQLYNEARRKNIAGRSKMSKAQLRRAVDS